jgi:Spy/CpxP family protein refolding chaperone
VSLARFITGAALVAALAAPVAASAQMAPQQHDGWHHHWHRRPHRNAYVHALRTVGLTDAQKKQIRIAFQQMRDADRAAMRANAQKLRSQIQAVLTPAQRTELTTTLARERAHRHHHAPGMAPQSAS